MTFAQHIRQSYRELQQRWTDLADQAFGKAVASPNDEMARDEFTSAFISEQGATLPRRGGPHRRD